MRSLCCQAERVVAVHCAKVVTDENKEQSAGRPSRLLRIVQSVPSLLAVASHYTTLLKAIQALHNRIAALHQFVSDVKAGTGFLACRFVCRWF